MEIVLCFLCIQEQHQRAVGGVRAGATRIDVIDYIDSRRHVGPNQTKQKKWRQRVAVVAQVTSVIPLSFKDQRNHIIVHRQYGQSIP